MNEFLHKYIRRDQRIQATEVAYKIARKTVAEKRMVTPLRAKKIVKKNIWRLV